MQNAAVFMDRDGTISEEVGYINHLSRFQIYPWTVQAISILNQNRFKAILVTNQAGVARGYFTEEMVVQVHGKLCQELARAGAHLDAIYYCPHHPSVGPEPYRQNCSCRKPKPGMLFRAAEELNIDLKRSFTIGDRYSDIELAHNAGTRSIFVLSGYGLGEYEYQRHTWKLQPDWVVDNLLEASRTILKTSA